jgi:hypothetical protein
MLSRREWSRQCCAAVQLSVCGWSKSQSSTRLQHIDDAPGQPPIVADAPRERELEAITALTRTLLQRIAAREYADQVPPLTDEQVELDRARSEIRAAIQSYASSLKQGGIPPERALVRLKEAVQAGVSGTRTDDVVTETLVNDGVTWCIDAYFHTA